MLRIILVSLLILLLIAVCFVAFSLPARYKIEDMIYEFALYLMRHRTP